MTATLSPGHPVTMSSAPLWRTAWRRLRRRPLQYVLLILGVALGVAMMVSIDLANESAQRAFQLSTDAVAGKATHRILAGPAGLDETLYRDLRVERGFEPAAPIVEGYVLAPALGDRPFRLVGVDPFAEPPFRSYLGGDEMGTEGGLAAFLAEPNTVILSAPLAEQYGLNLGDRMPLEVGGRTFDVRIVGLLEPSDDLNRRALSGIIFSDIATAQEILDRVGRLSHIDLIIADEATAGSLSRWLPAGVHLESAAAQSNAVRQMTAAFRLNLSALSLLALIVGMFLIYNTVTFSVVQRRHLFGILRSLGVTGGQLFRLILSETAILALAGALLGLGLGILLGRFMIGLVTQTINDLYFVVSVQQISIPPATLVKGLLIGLLAALVAAVVPALEAMRTTPQAALRRSTLESRARRALLWLWPVALLLCGVGAFLLWLPVENLVIAFAGLFAVLIGLALLTAPLTATLMRLFAPPATWLFGVLGRMAARDIVRSLSRTSVAIAALMTAVSVIVGVSIMIGSFRGTVVQWLSQTFQADIYLSPPGVTANRIEAALPPEVIAEAAAWPGVADFVTARNAEVQAPEFGRAVELAAVSGDISRGQRAYIWQADGVDTIWQRLAAGEGIIISQPLLNREDLPIPPPPITLMTASGPRTFPVLAVIYDYSSERGTVLIDDDLYADLWGDDRITTVGLFLEPGVAADAVVEELRAHFSGRQELVIQSNQGLRAGSLAIFDRTFAITTALRLLAIVVAFIGVLSALMSLQLERARELGILRATGMTVRQLWSLTLLETGLMGITAGMLALPAGYVLAWILIYVINVRSFGWTLQMDLQWTYFLQAFAVAVIAALLAGIYPAFRLGRMVVATALREE